MWDTFREIRRLEERMNRLFNEFWESPELVGWRGPRLLGPGKETALPALREGLRMPAVDVSEDDKEVKVTAEIPGVSKEDIKINITENHIEISAETKAETKEERKGYVYRERRYGSFYRSLALPSPVDANKTKASYKNGILEVVMPKSEKVKKTQIKVE